MAGKDYFHCVNPLHPHNVSSKAFYDADVDWIYWNKCEVAALCETCMRRFRLVVAVRDENNPLKENACQNH